MDIFISINNREKVIQLPIVPESFQVEFDQNNSVFHTVGASDLYLLGNKGLRKLEISSFFPNREYAFARSDNMTGTEFVSEILDWIDRKLPLRVVVTNNVGNEVINLAMAIAGFPYGYDRAGDVVYTLSLVEFPIV